MVHSVLTCLKYCNVLFNFVFIASACCIDLRADFNECLKKKYLIHSNLMFTYHYSVKRVYLGHSGVVMGRMTRINPPEFFYTNFFLFITVLGLVYV